MSASYRSPKHLEKRWHGESGRRSAATPVADVVILSDHHRLHTIEEHSDRDILCQQRRGTSIPARNDLHPGLARWSRRSASDAPSFCSRIRAAPIAVMLRIDPKNLSRRTFDRRAVPLPILAAQGCRAQSTSPSVEWAPIVFPVIWHIALDVLVHR